MTEVQESMQGHVKPELKAGTLLLDYIVAAKEIHEASPNPQVGKIESFNGRNFKVMLKVLWIQGEKEL